MLVSGTHRYLTDVKRWLVRAEEARAIAESLTDATAKQGMLNVAASYDALALNAKRLAAEAEPVPTHGGSRGS
jgi:hypothetical protein